MGSALRTVILASSVLYELIGPACAKLSLSLSHSYDANVNEEPALKPEDEDKVIVNLLIERIREIQSEIPKHSPVMAAEPVSNNMKGMHTIQRHFHTNNVNYH